MLWLKCAPRISMRKTEAYGKKIAIAIGLGIGGVLFEIGILNNVVYDENHPSYLEIPIDESTVAVGDGHQ